MSVSLDLMNHDVLLPILHYLNEFETSVSTPTGRSDHPLSALSRTSKRFRDECIPLLFSRIIVRGEWCQVLGTLEEMEASTAPSTYAKAFKFDISVDDGCRADHRGVLKTSLFCQLASTLSKMNQLEKLELYIPEDFQDTFNMIFKEVKPILPTVQTLCLFSRCHLVVEMCPNVRRISSKAHPWDGWSCDDSFERFIEVAAKSPMLTQFEVMAEWDLKSTAALLSALPHIRWLTLEQTRCYEVGWKELVIVLGRFPNLQYLRLEVVDLLTHYFPPPCYGDPDTISDVAELLARAEKEGEEARVKAAKMVGSACSELVDVWIGRLARFEIVRDANKGFVDVIRHKDEPRERVFWQFHSKG